MQHQRHNRLPICARRPWPLLALVYRVGHSRWIAVTLARLHTFPRLQQPVRGYSNYTFGTLRDRGWQDDVTATLGVGWIARGCEREYT